MKTLRTAYRVADLDRSVGFSKKVGFREIGRVAIGDESVPVMRNLPGDGSVETLERKAKLLYEHGVEAYEPGTGYSHLVAQVEDLEAKLADLAEEGVRSETPPRPAADDGPRTSFVRAPDGHRIELVAWPPGHADGTTRADFP